MQATHTAPPKTNPDCPAERHGTMAARTFHRCRCPEAIAACVAYEKRRVLDQLAGRARTCPATGTVRRVRALYAIGWPAAHLAAELGISTSRLANFARQRTVRAGTAERVRKLYDRLSCTAGPSERLVRMARAWGYVPPIGWDDDTIDDPAAEPWPVLDHKGQVRHGEHLATLRPESAGNGRSTAAQRAVWREARAARRARARVERNGVDARAGAEEAAS